ncbi:hypothetical protein SF285071_0832 [Shigella flexneri 2850-71]|nr:hypothetical protein SF285071_0832 [Shigella flexneri 2850-71]
MALAVRLSIISLFPPNNVHDSLLPSSGRRLSITAASDG